MSQQVAQVVGSSTFGVCFCHRFPIAVSGTLISSMAVGQMNVEGLPVGTRFSVVLADCGHIGVVMTGSSTVQHNGVGIARQGDTGIGCYNFTILTGAPNTLTPLF